MPPRRRLTRAEQQAETRKRLLDATIKVTSKRGLHEASLDEISEAAGYSRGAIYSNFKGKDDLLLAVFEERIEPRLREAAGPMIEAASASEQAQAMRGLLNVLLTQERAYLQLLLEFWGFAARSRTVGRRFAQVRQHRRQQVADMIRERLARRDGGEGPSPDLLAGTFVSTTIGILFEALVDPDFDAELTQTIAFELIARGAGQQARQA